MRPRRPIDPVAFIRDNTRLAPVPGVPEIRLHAAHQATGLWRLAAETSDDADPPPPYWAFPWAGGLALARHVLDRPATVAGKRVLDLGAGSGLVAIAAGRAGAASVLAAEIDPFARAAIAENARENAVAVLLAEGDLTAGPPPEVDLILVGDLFYEAGLAARVAGFLDRASATGIAVLVGDPGRAYLPGPRLVALADYRVHDVGDVEAAAVSRGVVYAWVR